MFWSSEQVAVLVLSYDVSIKLTIEGSSIIVVKEKPHFTSISMVWWHVSRDYRGFWKKPPYWPEKLIILTSWDTGEKLILKEGCWSASFILLAIYNLQEDFQK